MKISKLSGKFVIAVSGGVDSIVLFDLLNKQRKVSKDLELIVAHYDHGIRNDSYLDRQFVEELAKGLNLAFYYEEGKLGHGASEEKARTARYGFLNRVVDKERADGLVTAQHQDDLIETVFMNLLRGSGRLGLSPMVLNTKVVRPLLNVPKMDIKKYAAKHNLKWREDPTNKDQKYLRNYIRRQVIPKLKQSDRPKLLKLIDNQSEINKEINVELLNILNLNKKLPRLWFSSLDKKLSAEVLAMWLRTNNLGSFDRQIVDRLSANLKTAKSGSYLDVLNNWFIEVSKNDLALKHRER